MKKYLYLLLSLVIFSCTIEEDFTEASEDLTNKEVLSKNLNPVSLTKAWTSYSFYRGYQQYTRKFTVKIADLSYDKNVSIYHEKVDGTWEEIPLSYSLSSDNGQTEIWSGQYSNGGYSITQVYADEFVVKYEVDGTTYWDNNNGVNYTLAKNESYFFADAELNVSVDIDHTFFSYNPYTDQNSFRITVDVRNLAANKEVGVVYTTDGWQTQSYFDLSYRQYWSNGPFAFVQSPNRFGIERWDGSIRLDEAISGIEYAVVYKVNGQEYWDNNYGNNYLIEN